MTPPNLDQGGDAQAPGPGPADQGRRMFSMRDVAELCGISVKAAYGWCKPYREGGGYGSGGYQVSADSLLAIAKAHEVGRVITMLQGNDWGDDAQPLDPGPSDQAPSRFSIQQVTSSASRSRQYTTGAIVVSCPPLRRRKGCESMPVSCLRLPERMVTGVW